MYSYSKINVYKLCPKRYEYEYIKNLKPLDTDETSLLIGSIVSKGIELKNSPELLEYIDKNYSTVNDKMETKIILALAIVEAYFKRFGTSEIKRNELEFLIEEDGLQIKGFLDGLIETEDGYYIEEDKTAAVIDKNYLDKLEFDRQTNIYLYATKNNLLLDYKLDKPVLGIKYRIMKKPLLRQKQKENIVEFRQRLVEKMLEPESIVEVVFNRTDEQINETINELKEDIKHIENTNIFTKTMSACSTYGRCPYMELCMKIPDAEKLYILKERR